MSALPLGAIRETGRDPHDDPTRAAAVRAVPGACPMPGPDGA
ncbi:hypothetical protein [Streptosporangium roseum]